MRLRHKGIKLQPSTIVVAVVVVLVSFGAGHFYGSRSAPSGAPPFNFHPPRYSPSCRESQRSSLQPTLPAESSSKLSSKMAAEGKQRSLRISFLVRSTSTAATELALATWLNPSTVSSVVGQQRCPISAAAADGNTACGARAVHLTADIIPSSDVAKDSIVRLVSRLASETTRSHDNTTSSTTLAANMSFTHDGAAGGSPIIRVMHSLPDAAAASFILPMHIEEGPTSGDPVSTITPIANHVCPVVLRDSSMRNDSIGTPGSADDDVYIFTNDDVLISLPAVLDLANRLVARMDASYSIAPIFVRRSKDTLPASMRFTQWVSSNFGHSRKLDEATFLVVPRVAAERVCRAMLVKRDTLPSTLHAPEACIVSRSTSKGPLNFFRPSLDCLARLGVQLAPHQGIIAAPNAGKAVPSSWLAEDATAVSSVLAITNLQPQHWSYYHYFLNIFRQISTTAWA